MTGTLDTILEYMMSFPEGTLFDAREWKETRSPQQNRYYWVLVTQIANKMRHSKIMHHNLLLRDYGQYVRLGGRLIYAEIPDTEEAERSVLEAEEFHLKPTSSIRSDKNGVPYRTYIQLLGSSTYNTHEMSVLLDGTIQEAEAIGINTLRPSEIERMRQEDLEIEKRRLDNTFIPIYLFDTVIPYCD